MSRPLLKLSSIKELTKIQKELEDQSKHQAKFIELPVEQARKLNEF